MNLRSLKSPLLWADSYKLSHWNQIPADVTLVYSNWTPRSNRRLGQNIHRFNWFGLQAFLIQLHNDFNDLFFSEPKQKAVEEFCTFYRRFFCTDDVPPETKEKVGALHDYGKLPLEFRGLDEGVMVNHRVPTATHHNTHPDFPWITNFVETWYSAAVWHPATSATTAARYRQTFQEAAELTSDLDWFVPFQGHSFAMRGLEHPAAWGPSGAGHMIHFTGTDDLPAFDFVDFFYDGPNNGFLGTSVPATEHMVMCAGGSTYEDQVAMIRHLITKVHPTGIVSVVSDTWDLWEVLTKIAMELKPEILARGEKDGIPGKVVFRPDSSPKTPLEIICGDPEAPKGSPENKGAIRLLHEGFGAEANSKGFYQLHPAVGLIYGDAITLDMQAKILSTLRDMRYASTNVVLGIGSFTYQGVTRDSHGQAIKCTYVEKQGVPTPVFKDPVTDTSGKKSALGVLTVHGTPKDGYWFKEHGSMDEARAEPGDLLKLRYKEGQFFNHQSFADVRKVAEEHRQWI